MNVNKININQSELSYYIASDIYDVSAHNNGATFTSLSTLLSSENLSTLIPTAMRCGGMTIRFIQSSDNKYVQYRLMANTFSTDEVDWQGVDDEPTEGSDNFVKSGGVFSSISEVKASIIGTDMIADKAVTDNKISDNLKTLAYTSIQKTPILDPMTSVAGANYYEVERAIVDLELIPQNEESEAQEVSIVKCSYDDTEGVIKVAFFTCDENGNYITDPMKYIGGFNFTEKSKWLYAEKVIIKDTLSYKVRIVVDADYAMTINNTAIRNSKVNSDCRKPHAGMLQVFSNELLLVDNGVTTDKLADKAVTTEKLADKAVTDNNISDNLKTLAYTSIQKTPILDPMTSVAGANYYEVERAIVDLELIPQNEESEAQEVSIVRCSYDERRENIRVAFFTCDENGDYIIDHMKQVGEIDFTEKSGWLYGENVITVSDLNLSYKCRIIIDADYAMTISNTAIKKSKINSNCRKPHAGMLQVFDAINKMSAKTTRDYIIVDAKGNGDYLTIEDALNNACDTQENHVTIIIKEGTYFPPYRDNNTPYQESYRNLSLIGVNKNKCIIKGNVGYYDYKHNIDCATIRLNGNISIQNLTIISSTENYFSEAEKNGWNTEGTFAKAYCVHLDGNTNEGDVCEIKNCVLINNHFSCVGYGTRKNTVRRIQDCYCETLVSDDISDYTPFNSYGTLYGHGDSEGSEGLNFEFIRNIIISSSTTAINCMGDTSELKTGEGTMTFIGNICKTSDQNNAIKVNRSNVNYNKISELSYGNNVEIKTN